MFYEECYLGCPYEEIGKLKALTQKLNAKVVEQVNDTQELVMLNNFARESSECQFKKSLQERVSDIASWQWVLKDLAKRLEAAIEALEYEHNALRVVVQRVQNELDDHSRVGSRPGAFNPLTDVVEDAIMQEYNFLKVHKKKFENMIPAVDYETKNLQKTKHRIEADIVQKQQAISIDEACANIKVNYFCKKEGTKKKKTRSLPLCRWENRCASLKTAGLRALGKAAIIKQQVRGARTHLSIAAQAFAARVDSALRRRLHTNKIKLQDLKWQRDEALRDYKSLEEELTGTEQNLLQTIEQERVIESRLLDRSFRPPGELTRDEVDRKLRDELGRIRSFSKQLRINMERIITLQNHLADSMTRIDCVAEDLVQVICTDEERIKCRLGEVPDCNCNSWSPSPSKHSLKTESQASRLPPDPGLTPIMEEYEEEEDDYPLDD